MFLWPQEACKAQRLGGFQLRRAAVLSGCGMINVVVPDLVAATALLDRGWGKPPLQGVAVMTVAAPKGLREMNDGESMAMIEQ
jgi:hypothetical protein